MGSLYPDKEDHQPRVTPIYFMEGYNEQADHRMSNFPGLSLEITESSSALYI